MYLHRSIEQSKLEQGPNGFLSLLESQPDHIVRDTLMLLRESETCSGKLDMGVTYLYPNCRTKGHTHENKEEVYYIIAGEGTMIVGDDSFSIKGGDIVYVPYGNIFHKTENTGNIPMHYVWVTHAK